MTSANSAAMNATAQKLLRIVIASYFLAVALNLIPGTNLAPLFGQALPVDVAEPLATMLVFTLAFLVMIGLYMRPAALILGLLTFFASYQAMLGLGVAGELGTFWRDLVLIAALMLTYGENAPRDRRMRHFLRRKITPRRVMVENRLRVTERPQPVAAPVALAASVEPVFDPATVPFVARRDRARPVEAEIDNLFVDQDYALAS